MHVAWWDNSVGHVTDKRPAVLPRGAILNVSLTFAGLPGQGGQCYALAVADTVWVGSLGGAEVLTGK